MNVPLAPNGLYEEDIEQIIQVLRSGKLTMGSKVKQFEEEFARYLGTDFFVMMNSGSSANLAIIEALIRPTRSKPYLFPGDKVLVPILAWPTTVWPIIQLGLVPIFVDIEINNLSINLNAAKEILVRDRSKEIKALFPIHPLGFGLDNSELKIFCDENKLILIEDVCESLGSWVRGKHAGTSGLMSSFSFYFSHHMTTMEGGGVATNSPLLNDDLRSIRSHGWSRDRFDNDDWEFDIHPSLKKFNFVSTGFNIRPMEIQAAVGISQLKKLDYFIEKRKLNVSAVIKGLEGTKFSVLAGDQLNLMQRSRHSWMHIPIRIDSMNCESDRQKIVRFLEDNKIETRPPLTGNFLSQPAMTKNFKGFGNEKSYNNVNEISKSVFLVGCHQDLTLNQIGYLVEILKKASSFIK
jgi:CDP-6-deoxy-D-xylo-4-hexulose-3-dehydrase